MAQRLYNRKPNFGDKSLGISIGRGLGGFKGVKNGMLCTVFSRELCWNFLSCLLYQPSFVPLFFKMADVPVDLLL